MGEVRARLPVLRHGQAGRADAVSIGPDRPEPLVSDPADRPAGEIPHREMAGAQGLSLEPYFYARDGKVIFRAHCGGVSTSGSGYSPCELSEMAPGGKVNAKWQTNLGRHEMKVRLAVLHVPVVKPQMVLAQVHGGSDDITVLK